MGLIAGVFLMRQIDLESDARRDVCLIGDTVKDTFFPYQSPVGQTLEINGREFLIIGQLQKKEQLQLCTI